MAVTKVLGLPGVARRCQRVDSYGQRRLIGPVWILENPYETMQTDCEMRDTNRLDGREHHGSFDDVPGGILSMGLIEAYVEIREVPRAGF